MIGHLNLLFAPMLPLWAFYGMAGLAALCVGYAVLRRSAGALWRGLFLALLLLALGNPVLLAEQREPLKDTALVVVDDSASMKLGTRAAQAQKALDDITAQASRMADLDLSIVRVTGRDETALFQAVTQKLAELPANRLAGTILITDGQIHDIPAAFAKDAPLHAILAGNRDESDRRLNIVAAPAYGIVGKNVTVTLRVEDEPAAQSDFATVTLRHDDGTATPLNLPVGQDVKIDLAVAHAGQNLFAFTTDKLPHELTDANNSVAVAVNGIRDRLRVLLVSGAPHAGERVWRNFLKADPDVDLVHFTILRSPDKFSAVPQSQMALIAFPVRELFETKLKSFDLVIFDRFTRGDLISAAYLENVARYVDEGGALLIANSTADDVIDELAASPLGRLMTAQPTGGVLTGSFRPALTEAGLRHPVTAPLKNAIAGAGPWFRQIAAAPQERATVLLSGLQNRPLLALSYAGAGRVAQFTSDQFWLWGRRYDGGGPQAEMLRRVAHWLMKEPELDETALAARAEATDEGWQITATERSLSDAPRPLTVIDPSGGQSETQLVASAEAGLLKATIPAPAMGLYRLRDGEREAMVMAGTNGAAEYAAMRATAEKIVPLVKTTHGGVQWLKDYPETPELRRTDKGSLQSGKNWLGLQRNGQYRVTGSREYPLYPAWALLAILLATAMFAWRWEGAG